MKEKPLTRAQLEVLRRAAGRPGGYVCPTPGLRGGAQSAVLDSLEKRGLIQPRDADGAHAPVITRKGRVAIVPVEDSPLPEEET